MILKNRAFTLIELLIVIAIIAILTVAFLPGALKAPAKARDAGRVKAINDIAAALDSYSAEHNGNLPDHNNTDKGCLVKPATGDLTILASYFPNNTFPTDTKPVGNGACDIEANKGAYFYRKEDNNYIVGAIMEIQASGNTNADIGSMGVGEDDIEAIKSETLLNGGGIASTVTPDKDTPYYIKIGP